MLICCKDATALWAGRHNAALSKSAAAACFWPRRPASRRHGRTADRKGGALRPRPEVFAAMPQRCSVAAAAAVTRRHAPIALVGEAGAGLLVQGGRASGDLRLLQAVVLFRLHRSGPALVLARREGRRERCRRDQSGQSQSENRTHL